MFDFEQLRQMAMFQTVRQARDAVNAQAALARSERAARAAERRRAVLRPKCPHCGGEIRNKFAVCKHCGRELHWGRSSAPHPFRTQDEACRDREAEAREQEAAARKDADAAKHKQLEEQRQQQVRKLQQEEMQQARAAKAGYFGEATVARHELRGSLVVINAFIYLAWQVGYWTLLGVFWLAGFLNLSPPWWDAQTRSLHASAFAPLLASLCLLVDLWSPLMAFPGEQNRWPQHWAKTDPSIFRGTCICGSLLLGLQLAGLGLALFATVCAALGLRMNWWTEMSPWAFVCLTFGPLAISVILTLVVRLFAVVTLGPKLPNATTAARGKDSRVVAGQPEDEQFYFRRHSHVRGPFSLDQANAILNEGHVKDTDHVSTKVTGPWQPVKQWRLIRHRGV